MTTVDDELWVDVVRLHARVEQALTSALQRHGLGLSEYRALCHLSSAPDGVLRMQELADLLGLNQSSVTRLVGRLEGGGLSVRDVCPDDRRGVHTKITDEGRARKAAATGAYEGTLTDTLDRAATEDLAPLVTALRATAATA
ncbi:MarR family transcriptional regulator [Nonomuraea sp. NBC_01738]|uniref:MarR family winged helix-turn-helix transcriptional regulator n=1 Tax=Nonomuraea sp. NBC_01738 TaxID=2976003 RepID=UPI002E162427|nr:MarR family transcriptional regulator [Nonomuraea sp. NBC_01738]